MPKEVQILPFEFDPNQPVLWNQMIDLQIAIASLENPADPPPPREAVHMSMETVPNHPMAIIKVYIAQWADSAQVLGMTQIVLPKEGSPIYESSKEMAILGIYVMPEVRRQGVGRQLLEAASREVEAFGGITLIQGDSNTEEGNLFAETFGGEVALLQRINRLYRKDVDWDLMESWVEDGPKRADGAEIETFTGLPSDEIIDDYARIYTELINLIPVEELEGMIPEYDAEKLREAEAVHIEREMIHTSKITREADGTISGVTDILYDPRRPHRVMQELTGVSKAYQGRGLGKWLKADMMLLIREQYPAFEFIMTGNANVNAPMLAINEQMGFEFYKQTTMFKMPFAELQAKLRD